MADQIGNAQQKIQYIIKQMEMSNKKQNVTKCKYLKRKSKSSQTLFRQTKLNQNQKKQNNLNAKPSLHKNANTQNSIGLKQNLERIQSKQRVIRVNTIFPTFCIKVKKLSLNTKQKEAPNQNIKTKQQIQIKKKQVGFDLQSKCLTSVECIQQDFIRFKTLSTRPTLISSDPIVFYKKQLTFKIVNIIDIKIPPQTKQQNKYFPSQRKNKSSLPKQIEDPNADLYKNNKPQLKNSSSTTNDIQVQTYFYEDKYLQQYIKMRQVRFKSFQNLQAHFKYINQLGNFQKNIIQQRQKNIEDAIFQFPLDERQKRIFQMTRILELKENQMNSQMQRNIRDLKTLERKKEEIKNKYQPNYNQVISSINSLSKVIQKKLNSRLEQFEKSIFLRISQRISKQVKHSSDLMDQMMWELQKQEHIYNGLKHIQFFQKYYLEWKSQHYQNQVLIRNCVRKLLDYGKTNYKLFGEKIQQSQSFKQKQQWCTELVNKCPDCLNSRNKAKTIHLMSKALKPVLKVLNQMIRERQAQIFKFNSSLVDNDSETQAN